MHATAKRKRVRPISVRQYWSNKKDSERHVGEVSVTVTLRDVHQET